MKESGWECFAACVFAVLIVGLLMLISWHPPKDSGQLAAWVQAFGSIFAIFGSVLIFIWQKSVADRLRSDEFERSLDAERKRNVIELGALQRVALLGATGLRDCCKSYLSAAEQGADELYSAIRKNEARMLVVKECFAGIGISSYPGILIAPYFVNLKHYCFAIDVCVRDILGGEKVSIPRLFIDIQEIINNIDGVVREMGGFVESYDGSLKIKGAGKI